jgi:hypothetical protein
MARPPDDARPLDAGQSKLGAIAIVLSVAQDVVLHRPPAE